MPDYGYARALGLWRLDYNEIERKYDEPDEKEYRTDPLQKGRTLTVCSYPDFQTVYLEETLYSGEITRHLILLEVTSEKPRFGRNRVGLGSTRAEVQHAYSRDEKIEPDELLENARDYPNVSEGYYGQNWSRILFCYNEQGEVVSITYKAPAF